MDAVDRIKVLIQSREKEKLTLELKSWKGLLGEGNQLKKQALVRLAEEIAALANTQGGRLLLGLNDDGSPDGKYTADIDELKGTLTNFCADHISPRVPIKVTFIDCSDYDVFEVRVPKRISIPHAIVSKHGNAIVNRTYFVRSSHGRQHINDIELEWMFKHLDRPGYFSQFTIYLEFNREGWYITDNTTFGSHATNNFIQNLTSTERRQIAGSADRFVSFFIELMPYMILRSLSDHYFSSWNIFVHRAFDRMSSGAISIPDASQANYIQLSDIKTEGYNCIPQLNWNFAEIVDRYAIHEKFYLPPRAAIKFIRKQNEVTIDISNEVFSFQLTLAPLSYFGGLTTKNSRYEVLLEKYGAEVQNDYFEKFRHMDIACNLSVSFNYPDDNLDEYHQFQDYSRVLSELITDYWSYEKLASKRPPKHVKILDSKIDEILEILRQPPDTNR